jgi:hypothetical protein
VSNLGDLRSLPKRVWGLRFGGEDWGRSLVLAIALGLIAVIVPGLVSTSLSHVSTALLLSGACLLGGALIGFLFGVPRWLQASELAQTVAPQTTSTPQTEKTDIREPGKYIPNTNLEQISDWLTKILIGVGLVQLKDLPSLLEQAGNYFGPAFTPLGEGPQIAISIILYFSISGFLFGYLWTRIFLQGVLTAAENTTLLDNMARIIDAKNKYALGTTASLQGNYVDARSYYEQALSVDPTLIAAKAGLADTDLYLADQFPQNRAVLLQDALKQCSDYESSNNLKPSQHGGIL